MLSSNLLVEAAPHPPEGAEQHWHRRCRDRREVPIPEVGSWAGPSPRWHNRLSLDQLWCWGGAGLLDYRDAEAKGTPGVRGYQGLSWGKWTQEKDKITRGKYREAAATKTPREDPKVLRKPLDGGHLMGTNT